jgi:hypothetical protein
MGVWKCTRTPHPQKPTIKFDKEYYEQNIGRLPRILKTPVLE